MSLPKMTQSEAVALHQANAANAAKERPILFSGAMVRAILAGTKTQTRRVVKPQPEEIGFVRKCSVFPYCTGTNWPLAYYEKRGACWHNSDKLRCHYGRPGEQLWVRETLHQDPEYGLSYAADGRGLVCPDDYCYRDDTSRIIPSIHMPRWASRITLEIVSVRVERLQDISEEDARAEGVAVPTVNIPNPPRFNYGDPLGLHRDYFQTLWDSINGKRPDCAWRDNPWVWVIEFRRVKP